MIVHPSWTQLHAVNHGEYAEVTIHFPGPWVRTGRGATLAAAATNAMRSPAIAMGNDAPMLADVSRLDMSPEGPGAA